MRDRRKTAAKAPERRKVPTQLRSRRRLEAIVEAAAASFAELGYDATTMEGIAARAETSIGSLYQFFPNKQVLFREIAARALELARTIFSELSSPASLARPWPQLLDAALDSYHALQRDSVVMQAVWRNLQLYGEYEREDQAMLREFAATTATFVASWAPNLDAAQRDVVASMLVHTIASLLQVIARQPDDEAAALLAETKLMLRRYLGAYASEPEAPAHSR